MSHHTGDKECPLCMDKISEAHPKLRSIWNLIKTEFPDCHISWAFRGEEDQNEFFNEGRTRCPWPKSKHNKTIAGMPYAEAIDLFQLDPDHVACFNPKYYAEISHFLTRELAPIEWAGTWTAYKEMDHFELISEDSR